MVAWVGWAAGGLERVGGAEVEAGGLERVRVEVETGWEAEGRGKVVAARAKEGVGWEVAAMVKVEGETGWEEEGRVRAARAAAETGLEVAGRAREAGRGMVGTAAEGAAMVGEASPVTPPAGR